MAVFQSPFQFGTLATEENFIDHGRQGFAQATPGFPYQRDAHFSTSMGKIVACQEGDDGTECGR